jgi:hypothetical protein
MELTSNFQESNPNISISSLIIEKILKYSKNYGILIHKKCPLLASLI